MSGRDADRARPPARRAPSGGMPVVGGGRGSSGAPGSRATSPRAGRIFSQLRNPRRQAVRRGDLFVVRFGGERLARGRDGRGRDASAARDLGERRGLDGGADGDDLVGVDAVERRRAEELLDAAPHERDARRAADEDDLVERADGRAARPRAPPGTRRRCARRAASPASRARRASSRSRDRGARRRRRRRPRGA